MLRGIYTSASGMVAEFARQQALASDMANSQSSGYKRDDVTVRNFRDLQVRLGSEDAGEVRFAAFRSGLRTTGNLGGGVIIDNVRPNLSQGELKSTGGKLDLAIQGNGFFAVQDARGTLYTRNGNFTMNKDGVLATRDGSPVIGKNGPIQLRGNTIEVREDGSVFGDGQLLGQLSLFDFDDPKTLIKLENGLFSGGAPREATGSAVRQGYLEVSNFVLVRGMVDALSAVRSYEANQRVLQNEDETLRLAVSELGKLG